MSACANCHRDAPDGALFCSFCGSSIKPLTGPGEPQDALIGQTIAGKYHVHQLLGRGGMGDVYKATHLTLDRPVVLKLLKKHFQSDQSLVQRFHREARAASRLNHPNSITIIDFGQTDDGTLFMAMEYLAGRGLERVIAEEHPLAEGRVIHVGAQILAALSEAHALGIIHRDLKPANVMIESRLDEPDFVKVLDFGIAKLQDPGSRGVTGITQAGIVCGTPGYMSPEQVRGEELDARSDLYAVGVILYEMITGVLPFESSTPMGLVTKHLVEDPIPIAVRNPRASVSSQLDAIVMRALARAREERFSSAGEMRAALLSCAPAAAAPQRPTPRPSSTLMLDPGQLPGDEGSRPERRSGMTERTPAGIAAMGGPGASSRSTAEIPGRPPPEGAGPVASRDRQSGERPAVEAPAAPSTYGSAARMTPAPDESRPGIRRSGIAETAGATSRRKGPIIGAAIGGVVVLGVALSWGLASGRLGSKSAGAPGAPESPSAGSPDPGSATSSVAAAQAPAAPEEPSSAEAEQELGIALDSGGGSDVVASSSTEAGGIHHKARPDSEPEVQYRKGIRKIGEELNSIRTPSESSGEGVLTVVASPWAMVSIDGREIGETPREVLLGAGRYRVKATHPALGARERVVAVRPGKRQIWNPSFGK